MHVAYSNTPLPAEVGNKDGDNRGGSFTGAEMRGPIPDREIAATDMDRRRFQGQGLLGEGPSGQLSGRKVESPAEILGIT